MTSQTNPINLEILNNLIFGRVEPQIYAFSTHTIPNYLKVGDTYRPIETRLNEWRKHFPKLEKQFQEIAKVDDDTFFRDYAVHYFLENELKRKRLQKNVIPNIEYYSNEFFENATQKDLQDAIKDIKKNHENNQSKYQFYRFDESLIPINYSYSRTENFEPRPNQQATIDNFRKAISNNRTNLLMYAVMRFGKSFTSICCAVEMNAKLVIVVSAKADVKQEWKKTVQSHIKFEGYTFLESNDLLKSDTIIEDLQQANQKIVLFLTLQDLQGDAIKSKHTKIFNSKIDLLLIDESHFGARATEYGKILDLNKNQQKQEQKENDATLDDLEIIDKTFNAKIRIHLSGTPYRILMNSEFSKEDIIAFYQFTDIVQDQEQWDLENLNKDEIKEWDNPYYGFPKMIRFAFNPNESSRKKMEELKKNGTTYAFSALFKPKSISIDKKNNLHKEFVHETEILDLLKVIDGSETDQNILSFLDYAKIQEGKMCRHIVCVLPYRASCDALENLLKSHKFKHLNQYEILNISGVENEKTYKDSHTVQAKITNFESQNIKTITLTVNKMLTGSTVPEWDTMLYLKDTASPQEYDQAIFRLQNQYIKIFKEPNGDILKYNMKPQTLLVDFNPNRMFVMQEHKSQIYNVNTQANGNSLLAERIKKELEISPIIVLNNHKMEQIEPEAILDAIREYSNNKSVLDEATTIAIDFSLLDIEAIKTEIERQGSINSKQGLEIKIAKGEGIDLEFDLPVLTEDDTENGNNTTESTPSKISKNEPEIDYKGKFAMYYARILFFAFLTDSRFKSLQELINQIDNNDNNLRIAKNLTLEKTILELFQKNLNPFILNDLDYKIQNINSLANDNSISAIERASNAMKKFSRLSDSEVVTPETVTSQMIEALPKTAINGATKMLDIASKQGEFVYAVYKKFGPAVANNFYSIPTSKIAYEFTRKVYKLLHLNMELLEATHTTYDLIKDNNFVENESITINNQKMTFDVIVGNPPYQESTKDTSDNPIYHYFIDESFKLASKVVLIHPGRFLFNAGKTPKIWNKKMLNDSNIKVLSFEQKSNSIFPNTDIKGGIAITYRDKEENFGKIGVFTSKSELNSIVIKVENHKDFDSLSNIIFLQNKFNLNELYKYDSSLKQIIGSDGKEKRLTSPIFEQIDIFTESSTNKNDVRIFGLIKNKRTYKWIAKKFLEEHSNLNKFKVLVPKANGSGALGEVLSTPLICEPNTGFTFSFISFGAFDEIDSANAVLKYLKTKFVRTLLGVLKITQDNLPRTWSKIPLQNFTFNSDIDWSKSISEIDQQLYKKYKLTNEEIAFIEEMIKPMI